MPKRSIQRSAQTVRHYALPGVLLGALLGIGAIIAPDAEAATLVTSRAALSANDQLDWSSVGTPFNPFGPPDPAAFLPSSFTVTSAGGSAVQVDIPAATIPGVFPPFVFQTTDPGIPTNFASGDFVLFTGLIPGPPPAIGNPGPITLTFAEPVAGAGAQLAVDDIFSFTGTVSAFDVSGQLLDSFSLPGASSTTLDDSAIFLGVSDDQSRISSIEFSSSVPTSAIGINQLSFLSAKADVPEPSVLIGLSVLSLSSVLGLRRGSFKGTTKL